MPMRTAKVPFFRVAKADFKEILATHTELYEVMLRRTHGAFGSCTAWWKT